MPQRLKILVVHKRMLLPRDGGGKIRLLTLLQALAARHQITTVCNCLPGEEAYQPQVEALGLRVEAVPARLSARGSPRFYAALGRNMLSRYPFNVARNYHRPLRDRVGRLLRERAFDLIICDSIQMARHLPRRGRGLGRDVPRILFQHNVEAEIFARHASNDPGLLRRLVMRQQAWKMQRYERRCGLAFDGVIAVSRRDQACFTDTYGWPRVWAVDTAVDTDYFTVADPALEDADRVLFIGALDWLPNEDGLHHFVTRIWPRILRQRPSARFHIVGRSPSPVVQRLAAHPGVHLVGEVPDVRPHLARAAVCVVPLLVGGGTRLKIFEAMASGKAVVSTPLGAEGLDVCPQRHLLLADAPDPFAQAVYCLLSDPVRRRQMGADAADLVRSRFSAVAVARQFEALCQGVLPSTRGRHDPTPEPGAVPLAPVGEPVLADANV